MELPKIRRVDVSWLLKKQQIPPLRCGMTTKKATTSRYALAEEELFGAEFFYCVAELGGFFEFEFFGGFAHVGF